MLGAVVTGVCVAAALQLRSDASPALLAGSSSPTGQPTIRVERAFGSEPVALVVTGDLQETLTAEGLTALDHLERRARTVTGVQSVFGPATLVTATIEQVARIIRVELGPVAVRADKAAEKARALAKRLKADKATTDAAVEEVRLRSMGPLRKQYEQLFAQFGFLGVPSLTNKVFVQALMLGAGGKPKTRLRWMLPDQQHAVVVVRLRQGLSEDQVRRAAAGLSAAARQARRAGLSVQLAGAPLVAAAMARQLRRQLLVLLPLALLMMMGTLVLAQRAGVRRALLLAPGLAGAAGVAALSWPLGLGLTPATLAALPVILGLGLDFVVQLEARYRSERRHAEPSVAVQRTLRGLGPTLTRAACAMSVGFAVLALSPVPLVQRLGIVLALGVLTALVAALSLAPPLLLVLDRPGLRSAQLRVPVARFCSRRGSTVTVLIAVAVVGSGILLSSSVTLSGDPNQLASRGLPELRSAQSVGRVFGSSGQIRVAVRGRDVTTAAAVRWMSSAQRRIEAVDQRLRPGPSLADLATAGGRLPDGTRTAQLLRVAPPVLIRAILTSDRRLTEFSFGAPLTNAHDLDALQRRVDAVLATAPPGITASAGGLAPTVVAGVRGIEDGRPWLLLAAVGLIAIALLLLGYGPRRAAVVIVPAAAAAGASSLILAGAGVSLSPLSASLEPLLVAITIEFAMLVELRMRSEALLGAGPREAAATAVRWVGASVLISGTTVAVGFGVLVFSPVPVLRQFGLLAAVEVLLAAVLALVLVPALGSVLAKDPRRARGTPKGAQLFGAAETGA